EVRPDVDVHEPPELLGAVRLAVAGAEEVDRIGGAAPAGLEQLGPHVGGEDLAPGVVALEGREVAAVGEALETLLPARAPRARRDELEGRPHSRGDPAEARRQGG